MTNAGWQTTNAGWQMTNDKCRIADDKCRMADDKCRMADDKRCDETGHPGFPGARKWVVLSATLLRHENSRYGETKDVALTFDRRLQRFVVDPLIEASGSDADDGRRDKGIWRRSRGVEARST